MKKAKARKDIKKADKVSAKKKVATKMVARKKTVKQQVKRKAAKAAYKKSRVMKRKTTVYDRNFSESVFVKSPFPPPIMEYRPLPGTNKIGPFASVKVPAIGVFESVPDGHEFVSSTTSNGVEERKPIQRFRKKRVRTVPVWVHVLKGDERNGVGVLVREHPAVQQFSRGLQVRWAGGTAESLAKVVEVSKSLTE